MIKNNNWVEFFSRHSAIYNDNCYIKNTLNEVDFLVAELSLLPGAKILDIGCGTGRHSIELAKRGFKVTGLDLSAEMLAIAKAGADEAGVSVNWIHADATDFSLPEKYDAAIELCEGAFGLLGNAEDPVEQPLAILRNVSNSLKPDAKVIFTVLNAAMMLRRHSDEDVEAGYFDPRKLVVSMSHSPVEGAEPIMVRERGFVATELELMFRLSGMTPINIMGGTAGNWGYRNIALDEFEIMVIAQKTAEPVVLG